MTSEEANTSPAHLIIFSNTLTGPRGELHLSFWSVSHEVPQMPIIGFWQKLGKWYISSCSGFSNCTDWGWCYSSKLTGGCTFGNIWPWWSVHQFMKEDTFAAALLSFTMVIVNKQFFFPAGVIPPSSFILPFASLGTHLTDFTALKLSRRDTPEHLANGCTVPTLIRSSPETAVLNRWLSCKKP